MTWHDGRLCAFDLETSGTDYESDRIVTAAVALVGGGEPTETRTWLINPGVEIAPEATEVHGITTEHAREHGEPADAAIVAILKVLAAAVARGLPVVAFNARFDLTMLDREARRYDLGSLEDLGGLRVIDPFVCDKFLHRFRRGKRKLGDVCAHYALEWQRVKGGEAPDLFRGEDAHDAAADAVAAARLAWLIGKIGQAQGRHPEIIGLRSAWERVRDDLELLHEAQVGWAREQALSLAEYFARQGKPEHVEPAWPVVPLPAAAEGLAA